MALDVIGLGMVGPKIKGARVLCLGYPDITAPMAEVQSILGIAPRKFTNHGSAHKVTAPLPETVDTLMLAGAVEVDCVDSTPSRGCERQVDLNVRQEWSHRYEVVINPGTAEHCFDIAAAMFNAWRALEIGGAVLHVSPLSMVNHGFWNFCPTAIADFAEANGGTVLQMAARNRDWVRFAADSVKRYQVAPDSVLYSLVQKVADVPESIPVQRRFRA